MKKLFIYLVFTAFSSNLLAEVPDLELAVEGGRNLDFNFKEKKVESPYEAKIALKEKVGESVQLVQKVGAGYLNNDQQYLIGQAGFQLMDEDKSIYTGEKSYNQIELGLGAKVGEKNIGDGKLKDLYAYVDFRKEIFDDSLSVGLHIEKSLLNPQQVAFGPTISVSSR